MDTYTAVKNRILFLCDQKHMTINKLATASAVAPSTIKNILTLKMLCDGFGITLSDFFDTSTFRNLEQEIK